MKKRNLGTTALVTGALAGVAFASASQAATLEVTVTNEQASNGVFFTPLVSIFHDGEFDTFNEGTTASGSVEAVAEEGDASGVIADASAAGAVSGVILGLEGIGSAPGQPPLIDVGETASSTFDVDGSGDLFFSYLAMILPTNDTFIGNDNATAYQVFDGGAFQSQTISVYANDAWDAGTELNDFLGAPFSPNGGMSTTTPDGVITQLSDLSFIFGEPRAAGGNVGNGGNLIATISVDLAPVPLPAGMPLLLGGLGFFGFMRARKLK